MKTTLIAILTGASILLFSTVSMAGGEGCDSKKGAHTKDMSAEAMKQFKDNHNWSSKKSAQAEQSPAQKNTAVKI